MAEAVQSSDLLQSHIWTTWPELRENPVFRRSMAPRGFRRILRSPVVRTIALTAAAIALHNFVFSRIGGLLPALGLAIAFWFLVHAVQHFFCWTELSTIAATGTLADYRNSGLSRSDIAIGVIYPAVIAETIAVAALMLYFAATMESMMFYRLLLLYFVVMRIVSLFRPPVLFLPSIESYLRRRDPVALFSISFSIFVPILIWFVVFWCVYLAAIQINVMFQLTRDIQFILIAAIFLAMKPSSWIQSKFADWQLRRFYKRNGSFEELFDAYVDADTRKSF